MTFYFDNVINIVKYARAKLAHYLALLAVNG